MNMAKYWREASTLILAVRPRSTVLHAPSTGTQVVARANDFKILMLQRAAKSNFMPAKLVFPGGMISEADHAEEWENLYKNITGCTLDEIYQNLNSSQSKVPLVREKRSWKVGADIAFRIGAIRETFEECGLLIATNREELQKKSQTYGKMPVYRESSSLTITDHSWRKKVEKNPLEFLKMCKELQLVPDIWSLTTWRNWLTPVFQKVTEPPKKPRRFDTMFYLCCFDTDKIPSTIVDDSETTQAQWFGADEFIKMDEDKKLNQPSLAPPQKYELTQLSKLNMADVLNECQRKRTESVGRWMPSYRLCKDAVLVLLPGDYLYPAELDFEGTRDLPEPYSCSLAELTDESKSLNRVTFSSFANVNSQSVGTAITGTADVDSLLQNGTIRCNL